MPELPEVETIKMGLEKYLVGHKVEKVEVRLKKILTGGKELLVGGEITGVRRFAKVLCLDLNNGYSALIHLKMTGQPIYRGPNLKTPTRLSEKVVGGLPGIHTHVIFHLDRGGNFYFNDFRRFGWIKIVKTQELKEDSFVGKLGPEPLRDLTEEIFNNILSKTKKSIKVLLMDQTKIGGVGNIYANDALFLAGIHPKRAANSLDQREMLKLFKSVEKVLKDGIKYGGASEHAYVTSEGLEGRYQEHFLVYDRAGLPCPNSCGEKIQKTNLGGRGTYFCPKCQK